MMKVLQRVLVGIVLILVAVVGYEMWLLRPPDDTPAASASGGGTDAVPPGAIYVDVMNEIPKPGALAVWTAEGCPTTGVKETVGKFADAPLCLVVEAGRVSKIGLVPLQVPGNGFLVVACGVRSVDVTPERIGIGDRLDLTKDGKWLIHVPDIPLRLAAVQERFAEIRRKLVSEHESSNTVLRIFAQAARARAADLEPDMARAKTPDELTRIRKEIDNDGAVAAQILELGSAAFPVTEVRAALVRPDDRSEQAAVTRLQRLVRAGFNTVILESFRWGGSVNPQVHQGFWQSQPNEYITAPVSTYGQFCRQYGVDVWLWVQNGFLSKNKVPADKVPAAWLVRKQDGSAVDGYGMWLCLRHPEVRKMLVDSYLELVDTASAKCVAMDYLYSTGYDPMPETKGLCRCEVCKSQCPNIPDDVQQLQNEMFAGQTSLLRELRAALDARAAKQPEEPPVRIAVFCHVESFKETTVSLPIKQWMDEKLIDWVCPMNYYPPQQQAEGLQKIITSQGEEVRSRMLAGAGVHAGENVNQLSDYALQIHNARVKKLPGYQFFQASALMPEVCDVLECTVNAMAAVPPGNPTCLQVPAPPGEVRGTWLSGKALLESTATLEAKLDGLRAAGITTVMLNCWYRGYTAYPGSKVAAYDPEMAAAWGNEDGYAFAVEAIHRHGMKCAAWLEYGLFCGHDPKGGTEGRAKQQFMNAHKELMSVDADGNPDNTIPNYGTFYTLCPANPESYKLVAQIMLETVRRYPVDEVHLDRMKFANEARCYCDYCRKTFEQETGKPLNANTDPKAFTQWKREKNAAGMKLMRETLKTANPQMPLSAYVTWPSEMNSVAQSWDLWLARDLVDRLYVGAYIDFENTLTETRQLAGSHWGKVLFAVDKEKLSARRLLERLDEIRRRGAAGWAVWSAAGVPSLAPLLNPQEGP